MYTILTNNIYRYEIKKSKFITFLYKIDSFDDIEVYLEQIKKKYPDATHCCFAYIFDNVYRFSDDGEPSGTAGLPIMEVLRKNNLQHVLCVVIRYFGGIKLGSGGLTRAYSKCVREALIDNRIVELREGYLIRVFISYEEQKQFEYLVKDYEIVEKKFKDIIEYSLKIDRDFLKALERYHPDIITSILVQSNRVNFQ
ncbi:MAG: YigZ family protein [bacterium]|nr:YigZ family protein [bacterium]